MGLLFGAIIGIFFTLQIYLHTFFWGLLPEEIAWFSLGAVGAVLAFIIIKPIQQRFEKKTILIASMVFLLIDLFTMINLRFLDILPENGDPLLLKLLVLNAIFSGLANTI